MSVFNLSEFQNKPIDSAAQEGRESPVAGVGIDASADPAKDATQNVLDLANGGDGKGQAKEIVPPAPNSDTRQGTKKQTVELKGSLSSIYTKALNLAFAAENMSQLLPVVDTHEDEGEVEGKSVNEDGLFVYAVDANTLDAEGLAAAVESLARSASSKREIMVACECSDATAASRLKNVDLLMAHAASLKAPVYITRSSALRAIRSKIHQA